VQPIASYRPPDPLAAPPSGRPPDPADTPAERAPAEPSLASGPDAGFRLTSPLLKAAALDVVHRREGDQVVQQRLDAFRVSMTPAYHTPEGDVRVATPFAMSSRYQNQLEALRAGTAKHILPAALRAGIPTSALTQILVARGSPSDIHSLTQALIDNGHLSTDASVPLPERVRAMMFDHGIGIDCAGYTQRAYLLATATTRATARFDGDVTKERLDGLSARGYAHVSLGEVRPGDLGVLGPPAAQEVGHRVIVYDQHGATVADMRELLGHDGPATTFAVGGPIQVFTVDSSWGSGDENRIGHAQQGGVLRMTWWHNEATGTWAWTAGAPPNDGDLITGPNVFGHPLEGFYRRRDHASAPPGRGSP
jgi:hypothetical protein